MHQPSDPGGPEGARSSVSRCQADYEDNELVTTMHRGLEIVPCVGYQNELSTPCSAGSRRLTSKHPLNL
jgi:hypothetical protein